MNKLLDMLQITIKRTPGLATGGGYYVERLA